MNCLNLDLSTLPRPQPQIRRFARSLGNDGNRIMFRSNEYVPFNIDFEGARSQLDSTIARPTLKFTNVNQDITLLEGLYGSLTGATFTRIRTFEEFLDGGASANTNAVFQEENYIISKKISENRGVIEYELTTKSNYQNPNLPGQLLGSTRCTHTYRNHDPDNANADSRGFVNGSCPYRGDDFFSKLNNPTSQASSDCCSKTVEGCNLRFLTDRDSSLPIRGFPFINNQVI